MPKMGKLLFVRDLYLQKERKTAYYASKTNQGRKGEVVCVLAPETL
jgi:hypothetical protein